MSRLNTAAEPERLYLGALRALVVVARPISGRRMSGAAKNGGPESGRESELRYRKYPLFSSVCLASPSLPLLAKPRSAPVTLRFPAFFISSFTIDSLLGLDTYFSLPSRFRHIDDDHVSHACKTCLLLAFMHFSPSPPLSLSPFRNAELERAALRGRWKPAPELYGRQRYKSCSL